MFSFMPKTDEKSSRDYRDFRFRLRHDHLLRHRLSGENRANVIAIARELGFNLTLDDLTDHKQVNEGP